jgi:hypothetical protein
MGKHYFKTLQITINFLLVSITAIANYDKYTLVKVWDDAENTHERHKNMATGSKSLHSKQILKNF